MPFRPDEMWSLKAEDGRPFRELLKRLDTKLEEQIKLEARGRSSAKPVVFTLADFGTDMRLAREAIRHYRDKGWATRRVVDGIHVYDKLSDFFQWGLE